MSQVTSIRRILIAIPTLFGITVVTFVIINLAPGDPASFQAQSIMDPRVSIAGLRGAPASTTASTSLSTCGTCKWMERLVRLDFGESMSTDRLPVTDKIKAAAVADDVAGDPLHGIGLLAVDPDRDLRGRPAEQALRHGVEHDALCALLGAQLRHGRAADPVRGRPVGPAAVPGHDLGQLRHAEHVAARSSTWCGTTC